MKTFYLIVELQAIIGGILNLKYMKKEDKILLPIENPITEEYLNEAEIVGEQYEDWLNSIKFKYKRVGEKVIVYLNAI